MEATHDGRSPPLLLKGRPTSQEECSLPVLAVLADPSGWLCYWQTPSRVKVGRSCYTLTLVGVTATTWNTSGCYIQYPPPMCIGSPSHLSSSISLCERQIKPIVSLMHASKHRGPISY